MTRRVLLCEGPDDRSALREIVHRIYTYKKSQQPNAKQECLIRAEITVELNHVEGRERVLRTAEMLLATDSPSEPIQAIGLSFDPNGHDEPAWRAWVEARLPLRRLGWHYEASDAVGNSVSIVPLPWHWPSQVRYGCPDTHCLERIAIDLLAQAYPARDSLVARWMAEAGEPPGWKAAARLWNGLVEAESSGAGFFSKIVGQHPPTRDLVAQKLPATALGSALDLFLA